MIVFGHCLKCGGYVSPDNNVSHPAASGAANKTTRPPQTPRRAGRVGETFGLTFPGTSNTCLRPSVTEKQRRLPPLLQGTVGRGLK